MLPYSRKSGAVDNSEAQGAMRVSRFGRVFIDYLVKSQ